MSKQPQSKDLGARLRLKFIGVAMVSVVVVLAGIVCAINVVNYLDVCNQADARLQLLAQNDGTFPESMMQGEADADDAAAAANEDAAATDTAASAAASDAAAAAADAEDPPAKPEGDNEKDKPLDAADDSADAKAEDPGAARADMRGVTAETPYETRYFTVTLSEDGQVSATNTEFISAVSADEAAEMAQTAASSSSTSGFNGQYRYLQSETSTGSTMYVFLDCSRDLSSFQSFLLASVGISAAGLLLVLLLIVVLSRFAVRPVVAAYEKQKAFVTDASHEIKTPLAVISAANEIQEMEQGETEWSRSIADQVQRLSGLTEQLVQLARMDEGSQHFKKADVDISELVEDAVEPFYAVAVSRGKTLEVSVASGVHCQGDAAALAQVVELLLDNATRYAAPETVINLNLTRQGKHAQLEVSNEVEAMPKNLDRLFERFYRDDASRSSETGGTGVGLSVVRGIAEAHGGSATVRANGSRIVFTVRV